MDLGFTEEQTALAELAATILDVECAPEKLRALERSAEAAGGRADWPRAAWSKLAESGLVGIGIPTEYGGGGLGFLESMTLIEQIARVCAPLPGYATLVLAAAPIVEFGSDEQRRRWLPGIVDGSIVATGVIVGAGDTVGAVLQAEARPEGGFVARGTGWYVPFGDVAAALVVPVDLPGGDRVLVLLEQDTPGIVAEALAPMSGEPSAVLRFADVVFDETAILPGSVGIDGRAVGWLRDRAVAATCVAQAGTCAGALALTASYVSEREQFGVKLATLQAVSQRAADAWIDTEMVRSTAWAAAWRVAEGSDATDASAVAKFFAAEAAQRVVFAAQHLHGGIGMDLDYPIHRCFRWAKVHEQRLGGGAEHLAVLGRSLAHR